MPELPEVESIRRDLLELVGETIASATLSDARLFPDGPLTFYRQKFEGATVEQLLRRGKYLIFKLGTGYLIFSLRMTGKVMIVEQSPLDADYEKLRLRFQDEPRDLIFGSVRRFSRFYWHEGPLMEQENLARLGPDPLNGNFTWERFQQQFENRTAPIKSLLLDQSFVAGVGNIYASEILFMGEIDPRRPANKIQESEQRFLYERLPLLLEEATKAGGSSFTNFVGAEGEPGSFQLDHRVYDQQGEPCPNCDEPIQKITQTNRSTYFCPECQQ